MNTNMTLERRMGRLARLYAARARVSRTNAWPLPDRNLKREWALSDAIDRTKLPAGASYAEGQVAMSALRRAREMDEWAGCYE